MSMVQKDYILRMIEQMTQVIAVVLGLKKSGDHEEAIQTADRAFHGLVGFDLADVEKLRTRDLISLLRLGSPDDRPTEADNRQLMVIAILLHEVSGAYDTQGDRARGDACRLKALQLHLTVFLDEAPGSGDAAPSIEALNDELADYELPPETVDQLWQYHARVGQFSQAEDRLFELLEIAPDREDVVSRGVAFYTRLLDESSSELVRGGLPRREVLASLSELRTLQATHRSSVDPPRS